MDNHWKKRPQKILSTTSNGKMIHFHYERGLSGQDALDAANHHEKMRQEWSKFSEKHADKSSSSMTKALAAHHAEQSNLYYNDSKELDKSEAHRVIASGSGSNLSKRPRIKENLATRMDERKI